MAVAVLDQTPLGITWVMDEPQARASHALVHEGKLWLIDPVSEPEAIEPALALGEPVAVLQLLNRHNRDSALLAARLGVPLEIVPEELDAGWPFELVPVLRNALWKEVALWWPAQRALVVAEALGTAPGFAPSPLGVGVHIGLRLRPPRQLGHYEPEHLLVGHGPPLHGPDTAAAVREALARSYSDLPRAAIGVSKLAVTSARR
jgi:hypothetical protein